MAKATAMRGRAEPKRSSLAVAAVTAAARGVSDPARPDRLATAVLAILDVALDALRVPALVVDRRGEVVSSNAAARALIGGGRRIVHWSPPPANTTGVSGSSWEVSGLAGAGLPDWSFAIWRTAGAPSRRRWNLTARQTEVLELVARGMTNTSIAETLGIRLGTVEFHISAIFDKAGVSSRAALIATLMGG
jgi:DNA-binding CsgD family transcriptional regulator